MPQVYGIWRLGLEGTGSTHHSDSEIQTVGCSISTHMSMLTSVRRKKHTVWEGPTWKCHIILLLRSILKKKKFISQNFKGKKIHWFAVFANMSVNSYLHSNMSINIPTVTDFKLNVDLERNANHYTAFLQYKDNRQEYLQEHPCQENIVN